MANTTESKETVSRKELATYLRNLADQFESDGDARIQVGNKSVTIHPSENVKREVTVVERSALLRGDKEALELDVKWKKSAGASEAPTETETESEAETANRDESEPETDAESRSGGD